MTELKPGAINKAIEILENNDVLSPADKRIAMLRIGVIGGGCAGFQYSMKFDTQVGPLDKTFEFEGTNPAGERRKLKVVIDQTSMLYLDGVELDYVETLEGAGFKFDNPNVKSTCGCGSSFQTE